MRESSQTIPESSDENEPVFIDPDLEFIQTLRKRGVDTYKKCMQCGTCSATCEISPDFEPFPRKEMSWASWGMKERLMADPDVWLCYHCNDCSTQCPRGANPGDTLAVIRQESIQHWAFPRFLARWVNEPQSILLLLGIPTALLLLALALKVPIEEALGIIPRMGDRIVYPYSSVFPHWLLISFFLFFSFLSLGLGMIGIGRFWRAMKKAFPPDRYAAPGKGLFQSTLVTLKNIFTHDDFAKCNKSFSRTWSHMSVFFGFTALSLVALWIITGRINPFMQGDFVYPFSFLSPWKILANVGGIALLVGIGLMIVDRFKIKEETSIGNYFDWMLIATILLIVITGYATEALHYYRLEPHRHLAYFVHLVLVLGLILYLPYSKLAHMFFRTTALIYAEYSGRKAELSKTEIAIQENAEQNTDQSTTEPQAAAAKAANS
ncbi:MAG: quinone-interacting membrane-bound oxidoreductase complex subunit QmoC [bacterium]